MNIPYNFISIEEPTQEQLTSLMKSVLIDVKQKADFANKQLKALQLLQVKEAKERFKQKQNESK